MPISAGVVLFIMWIIAGSSLVLTALLGIVLAFHWFRYALNHAATSVVVVVYVLVASILLSGMFVSLAAQFAIL